MSHASLAALADRDDTQLLKAFEFFRADTAKLGSVAVGPTCTLRRSAPIVVDPWVSQAQLHILVRGWFAPLHKIPLIYSIASYWFHYTCVSTKVRLLLAENVGGSTFERHTRLPPLPLGVSQAQLHSSQLTVVNYTATD
eukprot:COSAG05_NODE_79_length_21178_cov_133.299492_5_plen_139_part_00